MKPPKLFETFLNKIFKDDQYVNYDGRLVDEAQKKVFHAVFDQIVGKGQKDKVTKMSSAMSATDDDW